MRLISITKDIVGSDFKGYSCIIFSTVRYNNDQIGKVVELYENYAGIRNLVTGELDQVSYSKIHESIKNNRKPEFNLAHIEQKIINNVKTYTKKPVNIDGIDYWITDTADLSVFFETRALRSKPSCLGTARITGTELEISLLIPFLQHATAKEINETILHEVAHLIAPKKEGHGPLWKAICDKIGGISDYSKYPSNYLKVMVDQAVPSDIYLPNTPGHTTITNIVDLLEETEFKNIIVPIIKEQMDSNYSANYYSKLLTTEDWYEFRDLIEEIYNLVVSVSAILDNLDEDDLVDNYVYSEVDYIDSVNYNLKYTIKTMPTVFSMFEL